jgi:hypothetical protein
MALAAPLDDESSVGLYRSPQDPEKIARHQEKERSAMRSALYAATKIIA